METVKSTYVELYVVVFERHTNLNNMTLKVRKLQLAIRSTVVVERSMVCQTMTPARTITS